MNENNVIDVIQAFIVKQFPKYCNACGKRYNSLAEYLRNTKPRGRPISYDAELGDWTPDQPIGTISTSSCSCGSSLVLSSHGMNVITLWRLMHWARKESKRRDVPIRDLLEDIREKIDERTLQNESKGSGT